MKKSNSVIFIFLVFLCAVLALSCNTEPLTTPSAVVNNISPTPSTPTVIPSSKVNTPNSAPSPPITIEGSFPNGAPPLNQNAELIVTIKTPYLNLKDIDLKVSLPESLELVSGQLKWRGDIPIHSEVIVIESTVKSVKVGSWTINVTSHIDPNINGAFGGTANDPIYVLIREKSAEWRLYPAYPALTSIPLPPGQAPATSYTPN